MAKERGAEVNDEDIDSEASADEATVEMKREEFTDAATAARRREVVDRQSALDETPLDTPEASIPTSPNLEGFEMPSQQIPETSAERKQRENVLKSLDEDTRPRSPQQPLQSSWQERPQIVQPDPPRRSQQEHPVKETPAERRRREAINSAASSSIGVDRGRSLTGETPAEKRRREAALGVSEDVADSDSDDDNTERVPQARRPGIRFAEEPIRGRK